MRHCPPIAFAAAVLLACPGAWAQTYKCMDAAGKVTYSSTTCDLLGMRDAGEVRNKLNVSPAPKPPQPPKAAPGKAAATATQGGSAAAEAKDAKKEPERRCFKTAKGIRCNDKPEEDEK